MNVESDGELCSIEPRGPTTAALSPASTPMITPRVELRPVQIGRLTLTPLSIPADIVAGDSFDLWHLPGERGTPPAMGLAVVDSVGHGLSASKYVLRFWTLLQVALDQRPDAILAPGALLTQLNAQLARELDAQDAFIAALLGRLSPESGTLTWARAGMPYPLRSRPGDRALATLTEGGPVLGATPDAAYPDATLTLEPGARLMLASDGCLDVIVRHDQADAERHGEHATTLSIVDREAGDEEAGTSESRDARRGEQDGWRDFVEHVGMDLALPELAQRHAELMSTGTPLDDVTALLIARD